MLREINSISRPWHNLNWFAIKPTQYTVYSTCMCFASWLAKSPLRVYTATDMSACMLFNVPWIAHALVMQCFQVLLWLACRCIPLAKNEMFLKSTVVHRNVISDWVVHMRQIDLHAGKLLNCRRYPYLCQSSACWPNLWDDLSLSCALLGNSTLS